MKSHPLAALGILVPLAIAALLVFSAAVHASMPAVPGNAPASGAGGQAR